MLKVGDKVTVLRSCALLEEYNLTSLLNKTGIVESLANTSFDLQHCSCHKEGRSYSCTIQFDNNVDDATVCPFVLGYDFAGNEQQIKPKRYYNKHKPNSYVPTNRDFRRFISK